jgi:hypothetical protein
MNNYDRCAKCGMLKISPTDYHPDAACVLFRHLGQSDKVEMHLRAVVAYGMGAQAKGVDFRTAMHDVRWAKGNDDSLGRLDTAMAELCERLREHVESSGHPVCPDPACGQLFDEHHSDCAYVKYIKACNAA